MKKTIVDFHNHSHLPNFVEICDEMGIDMAVLLSVGAESLKSAHEYAKQYPERFIPFHWIELRNDIDEELKILKEEAKAGRIKGVKLQPMIQHMFPNDKRLYPFYETCQEYGLVATWHAGIVKYFKYELGIPVIGRYSNPEAFDDVAFDFPELKICIAHLGGNYIYTACVLAEKHDNIYMDTAFLDFFAPHYFPETTPAEMIMHAVNVAGAEKVLFGSEGLHPKIIDSLEISKEEKDMILGQNAMELLNLSD